MAFSKNDPSVWARSLASKVIIAHDYGISHDHSTILGAGTWHDAAGPMIGVFHAQQLPLGMSPTDVVRAVTAAVAEFRPTLLVMDSRNQRGHYEQLANQMPCYVLGTSNTGREVHALRPEAIAATVGGKRTRLPVWGLSRSTLFQDLLPLFEQQRIRITEEGDGPLIVSELHGMQQEIGDAGTVRWKCQQGQHDDMAISLGMAVWGLTQLPDRAGHRPARVQRPRAASAPPSAGGWT